MGGCCKQAKNTEGAPVESTFAPCLVARWLLLFVLFATATRCDGDTMEDFSGRTRCSVAILEAAKFGDNQQLLRSLQAERPNCINEYGRTPLHLAASEGQYQSALHLLAAGALMDRDYYGRSPLHSAVIAGEANMTNLLMDAGAYVELRDNNHKTPLHHAAFKGHSELIRLLLTRSADINALDGDKRTPLHYTCRTDDFMNSTKLLAARGADLEPKDVIGFTPLHYAAHADQRKSVNFLLDSGVDIYSMDEAGWNALFQAAAEGHEELVNDILVRLLSPKDYPLPDPSKFKTQDFGSTVMGLPAWLFAVLVTLSCGLSIVCPLLTIMRRFTMLRKPYICDTSDEAIEEFVNEVWLQVGQSKDNQKKIANEWDKLPTNNMVDLHRVKD